MGNFNFYINVNQCLNMSNFDMLFYKLQHERKFHLSNVRMGEEVGVTSLWPAFHEIRNYMDRSPFVIQDYRLIFGIRDSRKQKQEWHDTVLYKELQIYYGLKEEKIFIQSREKADKNVTLIVLYDTDLTHDMPELGEYKLLEDLKILVNDIGLEWKDNPSDDEITDAIHYYILRAMDPENPTQCDAITLRFLQDYINHCDKFNNIGRDENSFAVQEENDYFDDDDDILENVNLDGDDYNPDDKHSFHKAEHRYADNVLLRLVEYTQKCVGTYCVFQKEIDRNSLGQNMLALLSIVDYISMDLDTQENDSNEALRIRSKENWEKANRDQDIQNRYGRMMFAYKNKLQLNLREMKQRMTKFTHGDAAPVYQKPEEIHSKEGLKAKSEEELYSKFDEILDTFEKKSRINGKVLPAWKEAYAELKERLKGMDLELEHVARDLSKKYKIQMEERNEAALTRKENVRYNQDDVDGQLADQKHVQDQLLDLLHHPRMTPSLKFQDQLNLENALEQSNIDIGFYAKCQSMIKPVNFLILIAICVGLYAAHHMLLQTQVLKDSFMLGVYLAYVLGITLCFFLCWIAPYRYFRKKIHKILEDLKEKMHIYIRGYYEKAKSFEEYINLINQLDALTDYIEWMESIQKKAEKNSREYLWHKAQIKSHLRKCDYFENLVNSVDVSGVGEPDLADELDIEQNVIRNRLYWPQSSGKEKKVE